MGLCDWDHSEGSEQLHKIMAGTNQLPLASNRIYAAAHKSIYTQDSLDLSKNRLDSLAPQFVFRFAPFGVEPGRVGTKPYRAHHSCI